VRARVCARDYNTIGFFVQGVLSVKCRIRLAALVAFVCNALHALVAFQLVVVSGDVYTLVSVGQ